MFSVNLLSLTDKAAIPKNVASTFNQDEKKTESDKLIT